MKVAQFQRSTQYRFDSRKPRFHVPLRDGAPQLSRRRLIDAPFRAHSVPAAMLARRGQQGYQDPAPRHGLHRQGANQAAYSNTVA